MVFSFFGQSPFNPTTGINSLDGKVILVPPTGGNSGIGKEQLRYFAAYGGNNSKLYLAARSKSKAEAAIKELESSLSGAKIYFLKLDLSSLASVKRAAEVFKRENTRLDILVNNAGIMALPAGLTQDGYELQFGTNYVGHHLLTRELLPLLSKTAETEDVRIINLSSAGHNFATSGIPFGDLKTDMDSYSTWTRYGHSKLSNILLTRALTQQYPNITSVSIHPGLVSTNLASSFENANRIFSTILNWMLAFWYTTPAVGALNSTWASVANVEGKKATGSTSTKTVVPGAYYSPVAKMGGESKWAKNDQLAIKLWDWTEKDLQEKGF